MISAWALREMGDDWDLRDGDCLWWQNVADYLVLDTPMFEMIKAEMRREVVRYVGEHHGVMIGGGHVETYYFGPAYLTGVIRRNGLWNEGLLGEHYGEVLALWRAGPRNAPVRSLHA